MVVHAGTDREAIGRLYDIYYPRIFRHCLRRLFLRSVAEDVASDVFLQIARKIPRFAGAKHDDFVRWAHAIATNAINALPATEPTTVMASRRSCSPKGNSSQ
jgi:DNA-directed RNA polymerase specialized sigma24 family protein